jgi:hypothetical protein
MLLFKGIDPLEVYMCDEGIARICAVRYQFKSSKVDYDKPTKNNKDKSSMHLTNFCLNVKNKHFIKDDEGNALDLNFRHLRP